MNKNNAGFLAVLGVAIVAAIAAFFFAPKLFKTEPETASQSAPKSNMADATAPAPEAPSAGTPELPTEAAEAGAGTDKPADATVAADNWVVPSFDVLRVEPDGSTVIAGKAEPGTTLYIMNGDTVIATTKVGPSGDFVVILDTPLAAGDYQLTLRITGADGATRQSEEVATVSVPETAGGELLAMVSKPGKASRIIAQPSAPAVEQSVEVAAAAPESAETAAPATTPEQADAASADTKAVENAAVETAAAKPEAAGSAGETAAQAGTELAAIESPSADASAAIETPALPEASSLLTTSAPELASPGEAAGAADTAAAPEAEAGTETEVALATPEAAAEQAAPALPADATVRVDAVEIEGNQIFIAGSATPGYQVRVAADGVVIGSDKADETGRFIVEATSEMAVGDHFISADLMDEAGENVLLRATVPFNRPEGEALAAVAPAEPATTAEASAASDQTPDAATQPAGEASTAAATADAGSPGELVLPDIASLSKMREEAFEALSSLQKMVSASPTPDEAAVAAALEDAVGKLKSAAMADLPAGSSAEAMQIARSMRIQAEAALAVIMPPAASGAGAQDDAAMIDTLVTGDLSRMNDIIKQAETVLSEPADMMLASADGSAAAPASTGEPGEPKTILQAPLASTPGAVIIRRGDTLWQISRRTYGEGVRYTTIYVANRSQIQNPDRIKPGQVFSVPETPLENAEEMHRQLLGNGKKP